MYSRISFITLAVFLIFFIEAYPEQSIQGGYSTKPLEKAVFDQARTTAGLLHINSWLNENYSSLTDKTKKGPRENLYYLIDSWVKSIYQQDSVVFPKDYDGVLKNFFSWSERLGVYGGNLVYNSLKSDQDSLMPALNIPPENILISLNNDMFDISSKKGYWSVSIPYYFMIWKVKDYVTKDGIKTQLIAISPGAASHDGQDGQSQSTLMFLYGPGENSETFIQYWSKIFGFNGNEISEELPLDSLRSHKLYDKESSIYTEYTCLNSENGAVMVYYSGVNGPYQWNRPYFIDFLNSLRKSF